MRQKAILSAWQTGFRTDAEAKSDDLAVTLEINGAEATLWGESLTQFLDQWPIELPLLESGSGARSKMAMTSTT